jgi:hypothetical protein
MDHYSWLLPEGLLLLGGLSSVGYSLTTELVVATGDQQPGYRFSMDTERGRGCSIVTLDGLVLTGGTVGEERNSRRVTRLNLAGLPTELPGLGIGREYHGCGRVITAQQEVRRGLTPCPAHSFPRCWWWREGGELGGSTWRARRCWWPGAPPGLRPASFPRLGPS